MNLSLLRRITRHLLETEFGVEQCELGIQFVSSDEMARVNQKFLQHEGSTDVITFDHTASGVPPSNPAYHGGPREHDGAETGIQMLHGEIFISVADAVKQAREFGTTWQSEIVRYVIHGLLHLRGFDDLQPAQRRVMKREENRLLRVVESRFTLRELARARNSKLKTRNAS
ncbi:MAG TPA: rRNA maturation RNase YbeY [Methylomirabilota bacterium]|nr:rRNA maturation RNase YbeY [Methylomirabilota bacterium]